MYFWMLGPFFFSQYDIDYTFQNRQYFTTAFKNHTFFNSVTIFLMKIKRILGDYFFILSFPFLFKISYIAFLWRNTWILQGYLPSCYYYISLGIVSPPLLLSTFSTHLTQTSKNKVKMVVREADIRVHQPRVLTLKPVSLR